MLFISFEQCTPDGLCKVVRVYSAALDFEIGALVLPATAAMNALDHPTDIAKVQEWLDHGGQLTFKVAY